MSSSPEKGLCSSLEGLIVLQILLVCHQLVSKNVMTLLQSFATIIPGFLDEEMILQHFFSHELRQKALISILINLHILRLFTSHLGDLVKDLARCVVALRAEYASPKNR
jgi:hypothetical protein